jgi:hypothetical protein
MKTGIYFDKETIKILDAYAKDHGLNRSEACRWCVREALHRPRPGV